MTYLAAAYVVFLLAVLAWLVIHMLRIARLEREVAELTARARERSSGG